MEKTFQAFYSMFCRVVSSTHLFWQDIDAGFLNQAISSL